ncbi:MAG: hypothetical protein OQK98_01945 [Gammaproteobacteria bacterium]|nr:hypothetical protein [Gammaproteobacteria bacterium]
MHKQQENIQRVVAGKVLKDIHKIVEEDSVKEKQEKNGALFAGSLILFFVILLSGLFILV